MSTGGCGGEIKAGIAPAGNGIRGFASFDLSALHGATIEEAILDLSNSDLTGNPFGVGALHIGHIEYAGSLCGCWDCLDRPAMARLGQITSEPGLLALDVTAALADYLVSGTPDYFQIRLRWDRDDAGAGHASMAR